MQERSTVQFANVAGGEFLDRYAERLARREILSGMVDEGHSLIEEERRLVRESEEELRRRLGPCPDRAVTDRATVHVLSRAVGFLRAYGCMRRDLGGRVGRIRADLERTVGSSPFSGSSAA